MLTRECSVPPQGAVPNQRGITGKLAGLAVTCAGRPTGWSRLTVLSASCPIRAQASPPRGVFPAQGVVARFPYKRAIYRDPAGLDDASLGR